MVGLLFSMPVANRNSGVLVTLRLGAARRMVSREGVGFIVHLLEPERQAQSAQKDERLSNRFYRLRENLSHRDQARLDRDEGAWLMAGRQCGGNRACIVKAYRVRLSKLSDRTAASRPEEVPWMSVSRRSLHARKSRRTARHRRSAPGHFAGLFIRLVCGDRGGAD